MPTPAWRHPAGLIRRLLEQPQRHDFFQAVHLIGRWLAAQGAGHTLDSALRFRNSISLAFPRNQIETLTVEGDRVYMTPAFIGFLGVKGVLPYCYTEAVAAQVHGDRNEAGRAFVDCFSQRSVLLFYRAWEKCRVEYRHSADGRDGFMALQLAIAGRTQNTDAAIAPQVAAHYAALIRQRTVPAALMAAILNDHFRVPVRVEPFTGYWETLRPKEQSRLGISNCTLGVDCMLGTTYRALRVRLWLGPLDRRDFDHFLKAAPGGRALRAMLALFNVPAQCFEVRLILRADQMRPIFLDGTAKLGQGTFLVAGPQCADNADTRYLIEPGDSIGL
ncbi:type VI secretion system protein ImpH [Pseudoduganella lurida]|uniref:Type VI secretion system protein ImpH n=1 Tax=Pseudoduganella lurida TaxID=1036180 RepID=A0A562R8U8_9BURK|nr:type VI secretion system baseplate subunit TssG [Pseudoduganella lurida]TWI65475.1 type VI secretion system protein ImpH [Pseudoduganella lurida]